MSDEVIPEKPQELITLVGVDGQHKGEHRIDNQDVEIDGQMKACRSRLVADVVDPDKPVT